MERESVSVESVVSQKIQKFKGDWLIFNHVSYTIGSKKISNYEMIERTTRKGEFDGIDTIAIISYKNSTTKKLIMIANFRPPVGKFVLEFPAGLVESAENYLQDAFRELKEETGYTATKLIDVKDCKKLPIESPILYCDPWKSNENSKLVIVEVDGDDPINQDVQQILDNGENIKVHLLDLTSNLVTDLEELAKKNNYLIEVKPYMFAWGIAFSKLIEF